MTSYPFKFAFSQSWLLISTIHAKFNINTDQIFHDTIIQIGFILVIPNLLFNGLGDLRQFGVDDSLFEFFLGQLSQFFHTLRRQVAPKKLIVVIEHIDENGVGSPLIDYFLQEDFSREISYLRIYLGIKVFFHKLTLNL